MMNFKNMILEAKKEHDPSIMSSYFPFTQKTGIKFFIDKKGFCCKLKYSNLLIGNPISNTLHGGAIAALLQNSGQFHLIWNRDILEIPKIINISINYLRKGKNVDTFARAFIKNNGRRVVYIEVLAWNEDEAQPIANAQINFLL